MCFGALILLELLMYLLVSSNSFVLKFFIIYIHVITPLISFFSFINVYMIYLFPFTSNFLMLLYLK